MGSETGKEISILAKLVHVANEGGAVVLTYKPSICRTTTGETYLTLREKDEENNGQKVRTWKEVHCSPDITFKATLQMSCQEAQNWLTTLSAIYVPSSLGKMVWHTFRVLEEMPDAITKANATTPYVRVDLVRVAEGES